MLTMYQYNATLMSESCEFCVGLFERFKPIWHGDVAMCSTDLQVATVDLIDNFQVAREQMSKQVDWPALQSFRKDGVVCVGTGAYTDVPGLKNSEAENKTRIFY